MLSAAHAALENGHTKYTSMAGLHERRQAICEDLSKRKVMKTRPEAPESDTHTLPTPVLLYMRADPALDQRVIYEPNQIRKVRTPTFPRE